MELKKPIVFWTSAALIAAAFAVLAPLVLPYDALRLVSEADRERAWLLTVFTGGVMAVLFGVSSLISGPRAVTMRDVAEAGGVVQARELWRRAHAADAGRVLELNFGVWLVAAGVFSLAIYFVLWRIVG